MTGRRAVVTGLGVVAPGGVGQKAFWELLTAGRTATRPISLFDATGYRSRIAAECDGELFLDSAATGLDRAVRFALAAAAEAWEDSGLDSARIAPERVGCSIGSAVGCTMALEQQYLEVSARGELWHVDHRRAGSELYEHLVPSSMAAEVARQCGAEGPVTLISTGCTSGLDAVGHGMRAVEEGLADVVVAGATDAPISPISVACFDAIRATSARNDDPEHASRPFDRTRDGFVLGEGAAVLILEEAERARRRGAHAYCEVTGFASRGNGYHMTGLKPDGREMAEAIRVAMREAGLDPVDLGYVNAHGSGTQQNDRHETAAFKEALGHHAYRVPVSSVKSMVGHSLGAIGSIELAACALTVETQVIPPTANLHEADPDCDLDYVPLVARELPVDAVLSVGSGFGGFQTAVTLGRPWLPR
jgi:act minimal PKS ketosynthase (KS/KS alpha)